jgi:integrase
MRLGMSRIGTKDFPVIKRMQKSRLNGYVFPGAKDNKPISDMTLTAVLRRMNRGDLTAHGFRSSFRDWCAEATAYPSELPEMALAHTINNKVEAAYRRGNMFAKRVRMMQDWAKWCAKPLHAAAVVSIRAKA